MLYTNYMKESYVAEWERVRAEGQRQYVLRSTLADAPFSALLSVLFLVGAHFLFGLDAPSTPGRLILLASVALLTALLESLWSANRMWNTMEELYTERNRLEAEEAAAGR